MKTIYNLNYLSFFLFFFTTIINSQELNYYKPYSYNINYIQYSQNLSVSTEDTSPQGIKFNNDGTKMFVIGNGGDDINLYNLTNPYDIASTTFQSNFYIGAQETNPTGINFNNTGTKMYVVGAVGDDITQYALTIPYNISTASYIDEFSVSTEDTLPQGIEFNNDGTKMYIVGNQGNDINQYTLSTAFDVTSASFDDRFSVSAQEISPTGMTFNYNGTVMYLIGTSSDRINMYKLSTAYDVTSAVYLNRFSISTEDTNATGITFNNNGTKVFITGNTTNSVHEYNFIETNYFEDANTNDGSINNDKNLVIEIVGDTFANTLNVGSDVTLTNVPNGLTPVFTISNANTTATLSFNGNANNHQDINSVSNIVFNFADTAFTNSNTADVDNAIAYNSNMGITFFDNENDPLLLNYYKPYSYNINNIEYNQALSVSTQETSPQGITFNNDGTKMFVIGNDGDDINLYNLTNPYDIASATFQSNFYIGVQETSPQGITFNNTGTKMYVVGAVGDDITQYALTIPYNISTASYIDEFSVSTEDTSPQDIEFNNDGTKMYVVGNQGNDVNQYTLSTAFDVTSASFDDRVSVQETSPTGMTFNYNGTVMYLIGTSNDRINMYKLSTAYDVTSASFNTSFSVVSEDTNATGIAFNNDGTKVFITGNTTNSVHEYNFIETNYFEDANTNDGSINNDKNLVIEIVGDTFANTLNVGSDVTLTNIPNGLTPVFTLSNANTTATLSFTGNANNHQDINSISNIVFTFTDSAFTNSNAPDVDNAIAYNSNMGITFFDNENPLLLEYYRPYNYTINNVTYNQSLSIGTQEKFPQDISFNKDGTKMFIIGNKGNNVNEYNLTTAYNISSAIFQGTFSVRAQETNSTAINFNDIGTKMYIVGTTGDDITQYALTIPYNISTASYINEFSVKTQDTSPQGIEFNNDGTKMYVVGNQGNDVNQYTLATPYDVTTASFDYIFSVGAQETTPTGMAFNYNGTKMFIIGSSNNNINMYTLTTAYDIASASFNTSFSVRTEEAISTGITFNNDGSKIFTVGRGNDNVYQYNIISNYREDVNNDGSIDNNNALTIELIGDTFSSVNVGSDVTLTNIPNGLTPVFTLSNSNTTATLSFTGNANNHQDINSISNIAFTFTDSAFTNSNATNVTNAVAYDSDMGITFIKNCGQQIVFKDNWSGGNNGGVPDNSATDLAKGILIEANATITADTNCDCLHILEGQTLTVEDGNSLTVANSIDLTGNIILLGSAQLIQTHQEESKINGAGSLSMDINTSLTNEFQFGYWTSPVTTNGTTYTIKEVIKDGDNDLNFNTAYTGADATTTPITLSSYWFYKFINGSNWVALDENSVLNVGEGFTMKSGVVTNKTYTFSGIPNDGEYNFTIGDQNYSLLGNPYPSAIDADQFIFDNMASIDGTLYFYEAGNIESHSGDGGGYATYNLTGSVGTGSGTPSTKVNNKTPLRYIPVGQGFFVGGNPGGTVSFKNTQRSFRIRGNGESEFFSKSNNSHITKKTTNLLKLGIDFTLENGNNSHRELLIGFNGNTNAYENGYDGVMFDKKNNDVTLSVINKELPFVIIGIEDFNTDIEIPLIIYANQPNTFKFSIDQTDLTETTIYLKDTVTNEVFDITTNSKEITLDTGNYINRFYISFSKEEVLSTEDSLSTEDTLIYYDNTIINIYSKKENSKEIVIYNLLGQKVISYKNIKNLSTIQLDTKSLKKGIYIVKVKLNRGGILTKKIQIH